jgi:hypothetical protein
VINAGFSAEQRRLKNRKTVQRLTHERGKVMATSVMTDTHVEAPVPPAQNVRPVTAAPHVRSNRRRHIDPQSGRALEILGHAIEYLADEYAHEGKSLSASDPQVEAIQMLMALNRKIYYQCPEVPTFAERLRSMLRLHRVDARASGGR